MNDSDSWQAWLIDLLNDIILFQVDNERGLEDLDTEELEVEERRGEG